MSDWTGGYVTDIGYTYGYYPELNPVRVKLAFLHNGLMFPHFGTACELGFGQGVSTNIHAAASATRWYGTDFHPSQAGFARELADASGADVHLYDEAFADFANRPDVPEFDYIGLHGLWSWISDGNREVIVDFIRRKLKVGGVLYASYNTFPGLSAFAPMRHLMTQHAEIIGAQGHGIVKRIDGALAFAEKLLATNPAYVRANSQIAEKFIKMKGQNRHYLAHEYFNRDWHPVHFATMAKALASAKVSYACSAHYPDHLDALNLRGEQRAFLHSVPDPMLRETVRDFMVNQSFRRDYWVKAPHKLSPLEQVEALRAERVVLAGHRPQSIVGALGEATTSDAINSPILDLLADHKAWTLSQIESGVRDKGVTFPQVVNAAMVLIGSGRVVAAQDDSVVAKARGQADRLNAHLNNRARSDNDVEYLASPITGGAIPVGRIEQLFLLAVRQGMKQPAEWAQTAWQIFGAQGQKFVKDGKVIEAAEENLAELTSEASNFADQKLPILKALLVA